MRQSKTEALAFAAAQTGRTAALEALLREIGDATLLDSDYRSLLSHAAAHGQAKTVRMLLEGYEADVDQLDAKGESCLHHACLGGHAETIQVLLAFNADPGLASTTGLTPMHNCALNIGGEALAMLLLEADDTIDLNGKDENGFSPLHYAINSSHLAMARLLLNEGANANERDSELNTPLHHGTEECVFHFSTFIHNSFS